MKIKAMPDRPNVLLFVTDQQRPDTLGFRGDTLCQTPNIDRIAAEGVSFDRAITPCPLCLPSRSSMFTGLYPTENDMMDNNTCALTRCEMLDHFRAAGYRVNYAGKWHMGEGNIGAFTDRHDGDSTVDYSAWCKAQGLADGWMFNDPRTRTTRQPSMSIPQVHRQDLPLDKTNEAYVADIAIDMLRTRDSDAPFFQVCSFNGPHPPFMIPEPYFSMYDPADVREPTNFGPQKGEPAANRTSFYRQLFYDHGADFAGWQASYAVYWGFVSMLDAMLGRVLDALGDAGLADNTIIAFVSDHGENLGAHGLWQKMVAYEESIRVPFLLADPRSGGGLRNRDPVNLVDLAPTLAALCGLPTNAAWRGRDLSGVVTGTAAPDPDRPLFAMHKPIGPWMKTTDWRMIQLDSLKYVWNRDDRDELYDLDADPREERNLDEDAGYTDQIGRLRTQLGAFLEQTSDPLRSVWPYR